jgi:hypothetical protein
MDDLDRVWVTGRGQETVRMRSVVVVPPVSRTDRAGGHFADGGVPP